MPRFFTTVENIFPDEILIKGEDAKHISRVLRMKIGEDIVLCDQNGFDYKCVISQISDGLVKAEILEKVISTSEADISLTLYMAMPKGDKMELIVQKVTELGANEIVPFISARCVSKPDDKSADKKIARYQKIAYEAAKQSGRGKVPTVCPIVSFKEAVSLGKKHDLCIFLYENQEDSNAKKVLSAAKFKDIGVFIGSEGGFEEEEASFASENGHKLVGLGNRILRAETAAITAVGMVMYHSDNF